MTQAAQNRREYFRLDFLDLTGSIQVVQVGERFVTTEPKAIQIENVGGGGLFIQSQDDLMIRRGIRAVFRFAVGGQAFTFHGEFCRKIDDRQTFRYGIEFIDVDEQARAQLLTILSRIQIEKRGRAGA
ncbi:MAG TPA: PilZ domain-containing protein [Symbiobacteriaceae bacterium]|nr:PilZ domain-containing protein [Symbiobacteriaceae bacterium]